MKSIFHFADLKKILLDGWEMQCIDHDKSFKNLSNSYWVYDELLKGLYAKGWFRFAAGFKAGIYGNPNSDWCIKIMGMGVGENPQYFCERGYYNEHERNMLTDFAEAGFSFQPKVLSQGKSIEFLLENQIVNEEQASLRVKNNDILIMERIKGIPIATQTGYGLDYIAEYSVSSQSTKDEMHAAVFELKTELQKANTLKLLNNDPMPPNILFVLSHGKIRARLVDFEIAQNLSKDSPEYVNKTIPDQYIHREVPKNAYTGAYTKNLDQHLIDGTISFLSAYPVVQQKEHLLDFEIEFPLPVIKVKISRDRLEKRFPWLTKTVFKKQIAC